MIRKYQAYRAAISQPGVRPISFAEWWIGRCGMSLLTLATTMAFRRADHASLNATLLGIWASNQSAGGLPLHRVPPHEISAAIREGRLHLIIEPAGESHG